MRGGIPLRHPKVYFILGNLSFYSMNYLLNWPILRFFNMNGQSSFGDLAITIQGANCLASGTKGCPEFLYGRFLGLALSHYPKSEISIMISGLGLMCIFITIWSIWLCELDLGFRSKLFLNFLFLTPPIQLLVERANFDIVVFCLLYFSFYFFKNKRTFLSYSLLVVAVLSKYYMFIIQFFHIVASQHLRRLWYLALSGFVAFEIILNLSNRDQTSQVINTSYWASFGFLNVPSMLHNQLGMGFSVLVALQFLVMLITALSLERFLSRDQRFKHFSNLDLFGLWSGIAYLSCYLLGTSYDYRLIFLFGAVPFMLTHSVFSNYLLCSAFFLIAVTSFMNGFIQLTADLLQIYVVTFLILRILDFFLCIFHRKRSEVSAHTKA